MKPKFIREMRYLALIFCLMLFNCSKVDPVTGEKVLIETNPAIKARKAADEGGGIFGNIMKKGNSDSSAPNFANSSVLWKATLKSLEFLPLANTDYRGGIIIYDWYSLENKPDEQIKITIRFLSDELRSDSIEVLAHKRSCETLNKCSTLKVDRDFLNNIKNNIIISARSLKIEEAKKIKN